MPHKASASVMEVWHGRVDLQSEPSFFFFRKAHYQQEGQPGDLQQTARYQMTRTGTGAVQQSTAQTLKRKVEELVQRFLTLWPIHAMESAIMIVITPMWLHVKTQLFV